MVVRGSRSLSDSVAFVLGQTWRNPFRRCSSENEATIDTLRERRQLSCRTTDRKEMDAPAVPSSALGHYRKRAEAVLVLAVVVKLVVNAEW